MENKISNLLPEIESLHKLIASLHDKNQELVEQKTLTITRAQLSMLMEAIDWRNPVRSEGPAYVA